MVVIVISNATRRGAWQAWGSAAPVVAYLVISTILSYATVMHLLARLGAARRFADHRPAPLSEVRTVVRSVGRSLTVLVPSYREETEVILRTVLSAALLEGFDVSVVLLIDDPPAPAAGSDAEGLLLRARRVPAEVAAQLSVVLHRVSRAWAHFEAGDPDAAPVGAVEVARVRDALGGAATELRAWASAWSRGDHGDRFFATDVLGALANGFATEADLLGVEQSSGPIGAQRVRDLYWRLATTFSARLGSFERKRYANLSHEANKAMNLNAYLGFMGHSFQERMTAEGLVLARTARGNVHVPDSDYVLTLDADSVLLPDYAVRLVHLLEQPANARVAVAQTPYSAFPQPASLLERVAGATTDVQYLLHQGMTHYGATFWVGANAVLRKRALDEIATTTIEDGHEVVRVIQDRTVIEDTESSIDLLIKGWSLLNYPERLAYSATPPDFGSLIIQRRRWANGGLIILPRLGELLGERRARREPTSLPGLMLQFHYLVSTPVVAATLVGALLIPSHRLEGIVVPWIVPLLAAPYLLVYAVDLRRNGYRAWDMVRVYALNMLLVAVNLAGGLRSLQQAATGRKAPFIRTPKISDRVSAPPLFIVAPAALSVLGIAATLSVLLISPSVMAAYAGLTAALTMYGLAALVGLGNGLADVRAGIAYRRASRAVSAPPRPDVLEPQVSESAVA